RLLCCSQAARVFEVKNRRRALVGGIESPRLMLCIVEKGKQSLSRKRYRIVEWKLSKIHLPNEAENGRWNALRYVLASSSDEVGTVDALPTGPFHRLRKVR